jgi:hypothetical protein
MNHARFRRGIAKTSSVEISSTRPRVDPLVAERGINPAESRTAGRRAALFSRRRSMPKRTPLHPKQSIASSRTPPQASSEVFPGLTIFSLVEAAVVKVCFPNQVWP